MATLEKNIRKTLKKESKKRAKDSDLQEKNSLLMDIKNMGLLNSQDYTIVPLDTVGRRRYQLRATR